MVSSLNGKITQGNNPHVRDWSSKEDAKLFFELKDQSRLLVMGRKTYEVAKKEMEFDKDQLRIVMTRDNSKYQVLSIKDKLEFTSESPNELVNRLEKRGFTEMLLLGGGEVNAAFFKKGLVDELILTREPKIFGQGKNLFGEEYFQSNLQLKKIEQLNKQGTLRFFYKVKKS